MYDYESKIESLEKENKIFKTINSSSHLTSSYDQEQLRTFMINLICNNYDYKSKNFQNVFNLLFNGGSNNNNNNNNNNIDLIKFLSNKNQQLEFQNFYLISKCEKFSKIIKQQYEELIEYSEVLIDIKNVVNQVFESQSLTREFLIIRETLNNRNEYLNKRKEEFKLEVEEIEKEKKLILSNQVMTGDKILEMSGVVKVDQLDQILNDKIKNLENLKLEIFEGGEANSNNNNVNNIKNNTYNELLKENHLLKINNFKFKNFIFKILKDPNKPLNSLNFKELDRIFKNTNNEALFSEDLFYLLKSQALLLENMVSSN